MELSGGYLTIARWRGAPIRLHLTLPIALAAVGRFEVAPAAWAAFAVLLVLHGLGHVVAVRALRQRPVSIDVHPFGGHCVWTGTPTPLRRAAIAWGGLLAQLLALAATLVVLRLAPSPRPSWTQHLAEVLVVVNGALVALNSIPLRPLDGAEAWRVVPLAFRALLRRRGPSLRVPTTPPIPPVPMPGPPAPPRRPPAIHVIRARSASEVLRALDAQEDQGNLPDVRDLVEQIFRKRQGSKRNLPN